MFDFNGKNALITGAASGIGMATAEYFFNCGANVTAADINEEALKVLADRLDPGRERMAIVKYDAASAESAERAVGHAVSTFGNIDHLVSAAGIYNSSIATELTDEQWHRMIAVNLDGVFYITRRAMPFMNDGSAIVTVASIAAHQGGTFTHSHYGATKGGVLAYTRGLARDLAPKIRANTVSPGTIETPMVAGMIERGGEAMKNNIPMRRFGKPSEIASVAAFLCSDAASYVTGEAIIVAGGLYMG